MVQKANTETSAHDATCRGFPGPMRSYGCFTKLCQQGSEKDMRKPWTTVDALDYGGTMSLLKEIRSHPFSGCAHALQCKAALRGDIWAIPLSSKQFVFLQEGSDPFIVGGRGDAVGRQGLEEGDQRLETEQAAASHVGPLSSFDVYFPGLPPAAACSANNAGLLGMPCTAPPACCSRLTLPMAGL